MKNTLLILFFLSSFTLFSQDVIDKITDSTCECLSNLSEDLSEEQITLEFGMCMMKASTPYMKELKEEFEIDLRYASEAEGEKLGRVVGVKMLEVCPSYLMLLFKDEGNSEDVDDEGMQFKGTVVNIIEKPFLIIEVEDPTKTKLQFHLITFIDTNVDISNYNSLKGQEFDFYYIQEPLFDGEKREFRPHNILTAIRQ
ncbi:hypothetical protein [Aureivirga sp. CE67]|uniref:hypothetical protein n=1 Tax=Aureivirga sp. CE67 TaxID=1788983 RepID=UPI0018CBC8BE|nr:hypothetical protein [Aureivirga sp. CE67]